MTSTCKSIRSSSPRRLVSILTSTKYCKLVRRCRDRCKARRTKEFAFIEKHLAPDDLVSGTLIPDNINTSNVDFRARASRKAQAHGTRYCVYRDRRRHIGKRIAMVRIGICQPLNITPDGLPAIDFPRGEAHPLAQFFLFKDVIAGQNNLADFELLAFTRHRDGNDNRPGLTVNLTTGSPICALI